MQRNILHTVRDLRQNRRRWYYPSLLASRSFDSNTKAKPQKSATPPKTAEEWGSQRRKREKLTMDEFFDNMRADRESRAALTNPRLSPIADTDPSPSGLASSFSPAAGARSADDNNQRSTASSSRPTDRPINSFFDQVNDMMQKNKSNAEDKHSGAPCAPTSSEGQPKRDPLSILASLPPARSSSPYAFEEDAFRAYIDFFEEIIVTHPRHEKGLASLEETQRQKLHDWLKADLPVVSCDLPMLVEATKEGIQSGNKATLSQEMKIELGAQKSRVMEQLEWDEVIYTQALESLKIIGRQAAKHASALPVEIAWLKIKELGGLNDSSMLQNFLYVSSTFSLRTGLSSLSGSSSISLLDMLDESTETEKKKSSQSRTSTLKRRYENDQRENVAIESAVAHDLLFAPSEQTTSIRVRTLVGNDKPREAEELLEANSKKDDLRLRTYAPVYQCYLERGDVTSAFQLYLKMRASEFVKMLPETYVQLLTCLAENGYFKKNSPIIDGVLENGYPSGSGPALFDALALDLAAEFAEISSSSARLLHNGLATGFSNHKLKTLHMLESLKPSSELCGKDELVASRTTLDESTGLCSRTGIQLRLINLDHEQKAQLESGLFQLAGAPTPHNPQGNDDAPRALAHFKEWLKKRSEEPFTAIVDGPNIGYYMQNFEQGAFNFHQIQFVVDTLESMGERVLVTIPEKYTQKSFIVLKPSGKVRQRVSASEWDICQKLIQSGKAYVVPKGCLDDYFWMLASIASEEGYVKPGNSDGRWPGIRPMLISNDKLRDHKLELLKPRLFRRWYSNFLVNYTFSAFVGSETTQRNIGFNTADFYSREIQCNTSKHGSSVWHFPISDWEQNQAFCVRLSSA